jgi:hypothetical protein
LQLDCRCCRRISQPQRVAIDGDTSRSMRQDLESIRRHKPPSLIVVITSVRTGGNASGLMAKALRIAKVYRVISTRRTSGTSIRDSHLLPGQIIARRRLLRIFQSGVDYFRIFQNCTWSASRTG